MPCLRAFCLWFVFTGVELLAEEEGGHVGRDPGEAHAVDEDYGDDHVPEMTERREL